MARIRIAETTREEREEIVFHALSGCGDGSCENCGSCRLGSGDPYGLYQPYVDGLKEISQINAEIAARYADRLQRG